MFLQSMDLLWFVILKGTQRPWGHVNKDRETQLRSISYKWIDPRIGRTEAQQTRMQFKLFEAQNIDHFL